MNSGSMLDNYMPRLSPKNEFDANTSFSKLIKAINWIGSLSSLFNFRGFIFYRNNNRSISYLLCKLVFGFCSDLQVSRFYQLYCYQLVFPFKKNLLHIWKTMMKHITILILCLDRINYENKTPIVRLSKRKSGVKVWSMNMLGLLNMI